MISMSNTTTSISMTYDAFGNRVSKTVTNTSGTTTTQYLVDDLNPTGYPQVVDELVGPIGSAAVQRTYTYGLQRISQDQYISNAWLLSYYQYDGGGSVRQLTNSVGAVTDSYEYDAFGNSFTKQGTTPNNYLYRGEQYDSDLGLYYLRARYYNPATGRFLSRDPNDPQLFDADGTPADPKSLHKYLYAGGDPVDGLDPSGRAVLIQYNFLGRVNQLAVHAAHHYWEVPLIGKLWCIHLQLLSYVAGVSGSAWRFQIPLPWCSAAGPF